MALRNYSLIPPANPILQVLYFLVGGVLLIGAVLMSAVILAFVLGFALVAGLIVFVRVWWLKRKLARSGGKPGVRRDSSADGEVFEVEYRVIDERDEDDR